MAATTPQSSRGALITWTVVSSFLSLIFLIVAIWFYVSGSDAQENLDSLRRKYADVVPESAFTRQDIAEIKALRGAPESGLNRDTTVLDAVITQRNELSQLVAGSGVDVQAARTAATVALTTAAKDLDAAQAGISLPTTENLALAVSMLANALEARLDELKGLNQDLATAQQQLQQTEQRARERIAQMEQQVQQVRDEEQQLRDQVNAYQQQSKDMVGRIEQNVSRERQGSLQQQQEAQGKVDELRGQVDTMQHEVDALRNRVPRPDAEGGVTRQADGRIISVPGHGIVYVDLGQRDSLTPGLTFEVYDALEGVPPLVADELSKGKASIEVTKVGEDTSEARVTHLSPGAILAEGDKIANLVYDRNTRYNFMVYGNFDLDQNGAPTPQDGEVVKRLITQWGGKLMDRVNVDTDFAVLGAEPALPQFTRDELNDPFNAKKLADAQTSLDQYLEIRDTAARLRVPILNQNRFLYLIGYYNQAPR
jgi:hypothetical protein